MTTNVDVAIAMGMKILNVEQRGSHQVFDFQFYKASITVVVHDFELGDHGHARSHIDIAWAKAADDLFKEMSQVMMKFR